MFSKLEIPGGISGFSRPARKAPDSLYVMANHGQLLEYSLDPVPDPSKRTKPQHSPSNLFLQRYPRTRSVSQAPSSSISWRLVSGTLESLQEKTGRSPLTHLSNLIIQFVSNCQERAQSSSSTNQSSPHLQGPLGVRIPGGKFRLSFPF